jgi:hypothetical protein
MTPLIQYQLGSRRQDEHCAPLLDAVLGDVMTTLCHSRWDQPTRLQRTICIAGRFSRSSAGRSGAMPAPSKITLPRSAAAAGSAAGRGVAAAGVHDQDQTKRLARLDALWHVVWRAQRHVMAVTRPLAIVQPKPEARHVVLHSFDGYTANVRLEQFDRPDVFLVHEWEGKPLSRAHGGPVRMLIPRLYFWKSAKWLRRIQFTISDHPGFWEQRGYHNNGDPWQEERYD